MSENSENDSLPFFCSWSGGKDSCLALFRMIQAGHKCKSLFTMIDETGKHSRSHGLSPDLLQMQTELMKLPLQTGIASWNNYEEEFKKKLSSFKQFGIRDGVFGDIDLQSHREWVERVCCECGIIAHLPLWLEKRKDLMIEFIDAGFKAFIVVINTKKIPVKFLGRQIDYDLIEELESIGVDPCGENGEYHTFVYDGPLFTSSVAYKTGRILYKDEYWFLKLSVKSRRQ